MGRSYWFECSRCGYRTTVSGGPDRGPDLFVQTISCQDCGKLYDAVVRQRVQPTPRNKGLRGSPYAAPLAPDFTSALNSLLKTGLRQARWKTFKLECPVSPRHRITKWNDPGLCPKCGLPIERNPIPYRIWE